MPDIFISHSHYDNAFCHQIVAFLRQRLPALEIFLDDNDLHGGDEWVKRIQQEVLAAPIFIVALSSQSVVAEWVAEETHLALTKAVKDRSRRVIPVRIDPNLNLEAIESFAPVLILRQVLDLFGGAPQQNWEELVRVVSGQSLGESKLAGSGQAHELEEARAYAAQVGEAVEQQQWRAAVKLGRFAVELPGNERDATLRGQLALALIRSGETNEGLQTLDTALKLNRRRSDLWQLKAQTFAELGNLGAASQAWDMAVVATASAEGKIAILDAQFTALARSQDTEAAEATVRDALELAPNDPLWTSRLVDISLLPSQRTFLSLMASKRWNDAMDLCDQVLRTHPDHQGWLSHRSSADLGRMEQQRRERLTTELKQRRERLTIELKQTDGQIEAFEIKNDSSAAWVVIVMLVSLALSLIVLTVLAAIPLWLSIGGCLLSMVGALAIYGVLRRRSASNSGELAALQAKRRQIEQQLRADEAAT